MILAALLLSEYFSFGRSHGFLYSLGHEQTRRVRLFVFDHAGGIAQSIGDLISTLASGRETLYV